jgi:hypothetical protein
MLIIITLKNKHYRMKIIRSLFFLATASLFAPTIQAQKIGETNLDDIETAYMRVYPQTCPSNGKKVCFYIDYGQEFRHIYSSDTILKDEDDKLMEFNTEVAGLNYLYDELNLKLLQIVPSAEHGKKNGTSYWLIDAN